MYGLECIPRFETEIGKLYLLQTANATYEYQKNLSFADVVIVRIRLLKVGISSFVLGGEFINQRTGKVCATATQTIMYTDLKGCPVNLFDKLKDVFSELMKGADE